MGRGPRTRTVVPGDLGSLPACSAPEPLRGVLSDPGAAWARAATTQWGLCGVAILGDEDVVSAYALVSPPLQLPTSHPLERWAKSAEAACLLALRPSSSEQACADAEARVMVQALARHLTGQVSTLQAAACSHSPDCLQPPVDCLSEAGFEVVDEALGVDNVRMQVDLSTTSRWVGSELHRALGLLSGLVPRPIPPAEPTGREGSAG